MITRCPTCGTMFKVVPDQLRISEGWVRCGECADVFQASEHLQPGPDEDPGHGAALPVEPDQEPPGPEAAPFRATAGTGPAERTEPAWDAEPPEPPRAATEASSTASDGPERPLPWWARPVVEPATSRLPEREDDFPRTMHAALPGDFPGTVQADLSDEFPGAIQHGHAGAPGADATHDSTDESTSGDSFLPTLHQPLPAAADGGEQPAPVSEFLNRPAVEADRVHKPAPAQSPKLRRKPRAEPSFAPKPPRKSTRESARESGREPASPAQPALVADPSLQQLSFLRAAQREAYWSDPRRRRLLWALCALLLIALALQWAVRERDRIAAFAPASKGLLQALCLPFGCEVGPLRQIDAIVIDSSSFRRTGEGRYLLNLTIKNTAQVPVAMPAIELTLTDTQDQPVLRRVLRPADLQAAPVLGAGADWSGALPLGVDDGGIAARIVGYRVLAFYP